MYNLRIQHNLFEYSDFSVNNFSLKEADFMCGI